MPAAPAVVPPDLVVCFDKAVPMPAQGPMTKADVLKLVARLKLSETEKNECGKRLIAFHNEPPKEPSK